MYRAAAVRRRGRHRRPPSRTGRDHRGHRRVLRTGPYGCRRSHRGPIPGGHGYGLDGRDRFATVGPHPHDRGDSSPRRASRHPARAHRRRHRRPPPNLTGGTTRLAARRCTPSRHRCGPGLQCKARPCAGVPRRSEALGRGRALWDDKVLGGLEVRRGTPRRDRQMLRHRGTRRRACRRRIARRDPATRLSRNSATEGSKRHILPCPPPCLGRKPLCVTHVLRHGSRCAQIVRLGRGVMSPTRALAVPGPSFWMPSQWLIRRLRSRRCGVRSGILPGCGSWPRGVIFNQVVDNGGAIGVACVQPFS